MLTVVRVAGKAAKTWAAEFADELEPAGEVISKFRQERRWAAALCDEADWWPHSEAIQDFVADSARPLRRAGAHGLVVTFGVALERRDRKGGALLPCDPALLGTLAAVNATLEFAIR